MRFIKRCLLLIISFLIFADSVFSQSKNQNLQRTPTINDIDFDAPLKPNSWSLIIYRPENNWDLNEVRCWLKVEDAETGEDVTYSKIKAKYEWIPQNIKLQKNQKSIAGLFKPDRKVTLYDYKRTYYLSGGMAMHLNLRKGKYKISVYTPKDKNNFFETSNNGDWLSNAFYYDTENPTNVIFVSPTADDNGFYDGGWWIDYKAPPYYKFTKAHPGEN